MVLGWIASLFEFKCFEIMEQNIDLAWKKLSNPTEMFKMELGSPLLQKVLNDGFTNFLKDYAKKNATQLIGASMTALAKAAGVPNPLNGIFAAWESLWFMFAGAMAANNDYILQLTKENARQIVLLCEVKLVELQEIRKNFIPLYNVLLALSQGEDSLTELYLSQLRSALEKVYYSERDVTLVANTLLKTSYFLTDRFETAKSRMREASELIQPKLNEDYYKKVTPEPYDEEFDAYPWKTQAARIGGNGSMFSSDKAFGSVVGDSLSLLARSVGIPATEEQFANMKLAATYISKLLKAGKGYFVKCARLNAALMLFPLALNTLVDGFPDFMKKMLEFQFSNFLSDMAELRASMAAHINGRGQPVDTSARGSFSFGSAQVPSTSGQAGSPIEPVPGYKPVIPVILAMANVWHVQCKTLTAWFDSIPVKALSANNLTKGAVDEYKRVVSVLNGYNNVYSGGQEILTMEAGVEELSQFEQQILLFITSASLAMYTFNIDESVLSVGRAILTRCDINIRRTEEIAALMQSWYDYELPGQEVLNQMQSSIINAANKGGFTGFRDAMLEGKYSDLLNMNASGGNTALATMAAISFLASCLLDDGKDTDDLDEIKDTLNEDLSLFNFSLELDLDFNIFKGILDCIKFKGLGLKFDLEEIICEFVREYTAKFLDPAADAVSSAWDSIGDSIGDMGESLGNSMGFGDPSPSDVQE